ncbi:TolC family protein [Niabella terrae]
MIFLLKSLRNSKRLQPWIALLFFIVFTIPLRAQQADTVLTDANLPLLIDYALDHQPAVRQSVINEEITGLQIRNKLADWYPQVNFGYNYQRNFQLPVSVIGGNQIQAGLYNTSSLQLTASQQIFNRDALLASRTRDDVELMARKQTETTQIDLIAEVSKAYYDLLATQQQQNINQANILMLERSLKDARARYDVGVADKTDYQRATIAWNNARASATGLEQALLAKITRLRSMINYPESLDFSVKSDSALLEQEIFLDTLQQPAYAQRVEYQLLTAQQRLQQANIKYEKWSYIPSVSANAAYLRNFMNDDFGKLYNQGFPNSYAGLTLGFPIFQGGKRKNNIHIAERQLALTELDLVNFKNQVSSEYATALAAYKSSMVQYQTLKENMELAAEVQRIIALQYREGVKTYLELITAQTDLTAARISYYNAVYNLLSSKIDVMKANGEIHAE